MERTTARHTLSAKAIKRIYADFGGTCAISDCPYPSRLPDGTPVLQLAQISGHIPGSPRYSPDSPNGDGGDYGNYLLLCPYHHRAIDKMPDEYPTEKLLLIRQWHLDRVQSILSGTTTTFRNMSSANRFESGFKIWEEHRSSDSEEFWHKLFASQPELLAPMLAGRPFVLQSKCFVGGKSVTNAGGNVPDFLAQHDGNATLIELKTPAAPLLSRKYREGVFPPSRDLAGACVQVLEYRTSLMNHLHSLQHYTPGLRAHSPTAVVIIGDLQATPFTEAERRSFEIFRSSLKDVSVITFDELFDGIQQLATLIKP